jgi:hypothetical protein
MAKIIIFKGKHGDTYYDASTSELKRAAFLAEIRDRTAAGWYSKPTPFEETYTFKRYTADELVMLAMDDDAVKALPDVAAKPILEFRAKDTKRRARHEEENDRLRMIEHVLSLPIEEAINSGETAHWTNSKGEAKHRFDYFVHTIIEATAGSEYEEYEEQTIQAAWITDAEREAHYVKYPYARPKQRA